MLVEGSAISSMATSSLEELATRLATGFEALLVEVGRRHQIEKALRERLEYARYQVCFGAIRTPVTFYVLLWDEISLIKSRSRAAASVVVLSDYYACII